MLYNRLCQYNAYSVKFDYSESEVILVKELDIDFKKESFDLEQVFRDYVNGLTVENKKENIINYILNLYKKISEGSESYE